MAGPFLTTRIPLTNRELSWLGFNGRVLEEAEDPTVPLLERVRFLSIFSSNLDEFFMVRVAGIWRQVDAGVETPGPDGLRPREVLARLTTEIRAMVRRQHRTWLERLLPELERHGVRLVRPDAFSAPQRAWANRYFQREVLPVLTPMAIDPGHPFPYLANRSICLILELQPRRRARGPLPVTRFCVIHLPATGLPRFIALPSNPGEHVFVLLEDLIRAHVARLFSGSRVKSCNVVRVTRDAELDLQEDQAEDLLSTIEEAVRNRRLGAPVRLQYEEALPRPILDMLAEVLELEEEKLYPVPGPVGLTDLSQLYGLVHLPHLKDPPHLPRPVPGFHGDADVFATIRAGDVLVHHPYEDFDAVVRFVHAAAEDPQVLAIKMTLYRVSGDSPIMQALALAARNGKEVAALVELKARFSEEANIAWARRLEATGAHVVYGIVGLKTHCKAALVVRREADGIRRYAHLATGNYNHQTARFYTDFGLFTCAEAIGTDLTHVFNLLTGYVQPPPLEHLVVSPTHLRTWLVERIRAEAAAARAGEPASIVAKMNSLADPELIAELYEASRAGVRITLVVRGICCLQPGVPAVSENIRVLRLVDRFLEHARVLRFENRGKPRIYLSSADWMPRNLNGRVELTFPVNDPALAARVQEALDIQIADTVKATELGPDGIARRRVAVGEPVRAQQWLSEGRPPPPSPAPAAEPPGPAPASREPRAKARSPRSRRPARSRAVASIPGSPPPEPA